MRTRSIVLALMLAAIALWLVVNRHLLAVPVDVSLFATTVPTTVGVLLIGTLAVLTLAFVSYIAVWQRTMLRDYRAQTKELESQRQLADNAEASRFTELASILRSELHAMEQRFGGVIDGLRTELRETESSMAATLGEMQDRLERSGPASHAALPLLEAPAAAPSRPRWFGR
jgi:hypothetical protein